MNGRPIAHRLAVAIVAGAAVTSVAAQASLEYTVKAALLLNFARYIEWPERAFASPKAPVEICVFTPDPFGEALERVLQGETVGTRPLLARDVRRGVRISARVLHLASRVDRPTQET